MQSLTHEYQVLLRQLAEVQRRCSAVVAAQAAHIEMLEGDIVRLRAELIVRQTRLGIVQNAVDELSAAAPGHLGRKAVTRHIDALVERLGVLSRECLRWRMAAEHGSAVKNAIAVPADISAAPRMSAAATLSRSPSHRTVAGAEERGLGAALDNSFAAADLVICQTGCLSHDEYWRVHDHCRRTGKTCILVEQSFSAWQAQVMGEMPIPAASSVADPSKDPQEPAEAEGAHLELQSTRPT